ncbi:MAG: MBL fold metallo-hydrolase [Anaerolineae bacterium]
MPEVLVLGSGGALPSAERDNTYLAVRGERSTLLIDCAGSPVQRLRQMGVDPTSLRALIVTHHHPDHIYGVPILILGMWLLGRQGELEIYGPLKAVASVASLLEVLDASDWPALFGNVFHAIPLIEHNLVLETEDFRVYSSPVAHMVACVALRIEHKASGSVMVYSSDTEPCEALIRLGMGANLLLHEATGNFQGHSSPRQAGEMAQEMGAERLVLVHLSNDGDEEQWQREAQEMFAGPVFVAHDLERFEF